MLMFLQCAFAAAGGPTAVPAAPYRPAVVEKAESAAPLLPRSAPSMTIVLPEPSAAEKAALRAENAKLLQGAPRRAAVKARPLAIAYGRTVPNASQSISLDGLPWQTLADGTRAARLDITSPGAAAVRVALTLPQTDPDLVVRFAGSNPDRTFGPVPANAIAAETTSASMYWSPVLEGDTAHIEFEAGPSVKITGVTLGMPMISHQVAAPASLNRLDAKTVQDIGSALPCEIDVKCVQPQSAALVNAGNAVAQMLFTETNGLSYLCTGQLLNDANTDFVPYFFTANHCIDNATAARTLNTFWFFDAVSCGNNAVPPGYVQQAAGAALLARSDDWDWALLRLNIAPPAGAFFSGWRAEPVAAGAVLTVIHHPNGDLKKFSQGNASSYVPDGVYAGTTTATFLRMTYTQGQTEGGSSGSAILTLSQDGTYYEVRGGLYNGVIGSCPRPAGYYDDYSRLDNMLPLVRQYLTPSAVTATDPVVVVEFYNKALNHYFMSANPIEINDLDTGVHVGWERTGIRFLAYNYQAAGTSPVCRFYRTPAFGDSHFYSASPAECAATAAAHPIDWTYESGNVFYLFVPDAAGNCPAGTNRLWRFFNQVTTNHRYTPEIKIRDQLRADPATWIPEGNGPDVVVMCTPVGS
jgi:hypothetical protein